MRLEIAPVAVYYFPAVMSKHLERLIAVCILSLLAGPLCAQATAALGGTVADPTGAMVPAAQLVLINDDTGARRETRSDAQGRYSFAQLPPGRYRLTARRAGFADLTIGGIRLLVNTPATLAVAFEKLGAVAETVAVSAQAAQVNLTDASIGNAIGDKPITQLPFEARNVLGLLSLQPGVLYLGEPNPGGIGDYRSGAVNGGKSDQANVTLDGVDVNEQQNRAAFTSVLRVTLDSVQEFRTITTNAGADFGRTSGAQVALVTKSGSNTLHGSVYEYLRNTATSANDFFSKQAGVERARLNRNVYGASFGGPIQANRLFFFLNYEGRKDRSEAVASARSVPTADFRNGIFTY
ncbi:MAG: carboxypeptidase-like regulatory domain-containing protein, partial [Acidobacteriia bacterium]|nr:carboxypeptidase-like regulatory domain-containing protein [Terriglobia bacterium]